MRGRGDYAVSTSDRGTKRKHFRREDLVRALKENGDKRWKKALRQDLEDLAKDEAGLAHLTSAIKAVLRSERWLRSKK